MAQSGNNTVLSLNDGHSLTFTALAPNQLTAANFRFG